MASAAAMSTWIDANRQAAPAKASKAPLGSKRRPAAKGKTARGKLSHRPNGGSATEAAAPSHAARTGPDAGTPLRIPYGNKEAAFALGARYGAQGWYAPPGADLAAFRERGWL